jgi:hypothetical protein
MTPVCGELSITFSADIEIFVYGMKFADLTLK